MVHAPVLEAARRMAATRHRIPAGPKTAIITVNVMEANGSRNRTSWD
jgi:hypothetical protein